MTQRAAPWWSFRLTVFERSAVVATLLILCFSLLPKMWKVPVSETVAATDSGDRFVIADTNIVYRVAVNVASADILELVPGIGPKMAERIIAERRKAPFLSMSELERRVSGIGSFSKAKIEPYLSFDSTSRGVR